jgi:hypothetical protein
MRLSESDPAGVSLAEIVTVRRRFLRSVNLEQDFYTANPLDGYVLTSAGVAALERMAEGVKHTYARAYSITGAYGSGKSAFALFASKVLAVGKEPDGSPRTRAMASLPALRDLLPEAEGFLPILLTGSRAPVAHTLLLGLLDALNHSPLDGAAGIVRKLRKEHKAVLSGESPTSAEATQVFARAAEIAQKTISGCRGLLVVVDEMGKFLEYAALNPEQGDLQLFQELAEHAARSESAPLLLVTILHQAFEEYAHRLSATQRREWQKVQGRFVDIPFVDGADETVRLIARAIRHEERFDYQERLEQAVETSLAWCRRLNLFPPGLSAAEFRELLLNAYPLHPLTLLLMPHIFRRFGQSERSLFSFLSSEEPNGFQEFLRNHLLTATTTPMLRPDHLYDYVVATLGSILFAHQTAKLWSETEEAVYRVRDKDPLQAQLIKTIGLMHILGEQTGILPSKEVLQFALADGEIMPQEIEAELDALKTATLIVYRQFRQAYRLYEGSDVDIEARLRDARAHFAQGTDSVQVAARLEVTRPLVARQHSYRTGTLRIFEVRHCRPGTLEAEIQAGRGQSDGGMLLCLAADVEELDGVTRLAAEMLPSHPEILLGVSVETDALYETAVAVNCLLWVDAETPELGHDRVAKREVRERLSEATGAFQQEWDRLLRPQGLAGEGGAWYHKGEEVPVSSPRELQHLVSKACDDAYPLTPILQNELINRRQLSSTAAAARRNLIEAMLRHQTVPRLGLESYPPEVSMYISALLNTGIHRVKEGETWAIMPPPAERDNALLQAWNEIESFLFNEELEAQSLTMLNTCLRAKPYGITEGLIPILICAVLIYHEKEVPVYEDGRFVTELDAATFERMIKRPADFKLRGCRIVGERQAVLSRFAQGLLQNDEEVTLINVIRVLYRAFNRLPEYTARTKELSAEALALRDLFKESREPEHLLFMDLPRLFGLRPFGEQEADPENVFAFFAPWNATMLEVVGTYGRLLTHIESQLCEAFEAGDWEELRLRAITVASYVTESKLTAFAVRASDKTLSREKWLESVAAGVMGRPPSGWTDRDALRFGAQLPALAQAFQHSELLHFEKGRHRASDKQTAVRLAVTQETGEETARVVLVPKADTKRIERLTRQLRQVIEGILQNEPQEIRLAVLAQVTQELLRGNENE